MKNFINHLTKIWHKITKKNKKEKGQTVETLPKSLSTTSLLSQAPSLSLASLLEDDFVPYERQMSCSVRSLPCLDDNSSIQNLEYKQTSGHSSSLELISRNRCLSGRCTYINCSTVGHSSYQSSFSCQLDTFDLFPFKPKSHFGSRKRVLNLGNDDFIERPNQFDILKSTEVGTYMGQHHKKQKCQVNKLTTEKTKEHVDSHQVHQYRQKDKEPVVIRMKDLHEKHHPKKKAHLFQQKEMKGQKMLRKGGDRKGSPKKKVHVFHQKGGERKGSPRRRAHVFYQKGRDRKGNMKRKVLLQDKFWDRKERLRIRRRAHVFHRKGCGGKEIPRTKAIVFHQQGCDRRESLRRRAHVFHQKGRDRKGSLRRRARVFHQKGRDRKGSLRRRAQVFPQKGRDRKGSLRRRAHVFHQKGRDRKGRPRKKVHVFHQKDGDRKGSLRRRAHVFHQKGTDRKGSLRRRAHVFHQKGRDRKGSLRRRAHVFHQKGRDRKGSLRRRAHVFHQKGTDRKGSLRRRAHVFHQKGRDRKGRPRKKVHVFHQKDGERKGSLRRRAHVFHQKGRDRKGRPRKKVHVFHQKDGDRKGSLRRRAHVFHQKGRDRKGSLRRRAHVFHQKDEDRKGNLQRRAIVFHQQGCDRRESLRRKACVFHQKGLDRKEKNMPVFQWKLLGGKNCLGRNAHVFQLRVFDGKDGVEAWAKEQLFCSTPVLDHKCSRTNSGNKKRKKQLNTPRKLLQKNPWETWQTIETEHMFGKKKIVQKQAKDISQRNLRKLPGKLTTEQRYKVQRDVGQIIGRPWPVFKRRPGGKTSLPNLSRVLQPRNEQAKQDAQHRPQQPIQPEVQQTSQLQQGRHAAQLLPVQSEQDSESIDQHTTHFGAVHHDMSQTEQAAGEREAYSADFQKKLPSAKGCVVFKRRSLVLYHTCQIDCILFTIFLLVHHHPQMEQMLRNADDDFQWLYCIWNKCRTGKFEDAKLAFWLRHGIALPEEDFIDFKVKLEADWILEPLKIKIFHQMSKCKTCNESCVFGEVDQDEYFQNSIGAFAKRCVGLGKQFASFQDCIDAWSAEYVPCSKCVDGYCLVTRGLDCDQGQPPLLPVPTFFEESECSGCLGEFLLPVSLDDHHPTLEQPQEFSTGNCHYQLHALSYAIIKQTRTGENYIHERCKVWDDSLGRWQYFDGEGWNEDYSNYKMKTAADNTPGKSYRVAYFRLVNN